MLVGLAAAALTAVAGARTWAHASGRSAGVRVTGTASGSESAPLVVALGLVALAAWGVVLVLRGRVRRVVAGLGALASLGALAAALASPGRARSDAVHAAVAKGGLDPDAFTVSLGGWYWVALVGAALATAAFVVAVLHLPAWPAMGSRYDAPSAQPAPEEPATERELWKALDDGRDPTA